MYHSASSYSSFADTQITSADNRTQALTDTAAMIGCVPIAEPHARSSEEATKGFDGAQARSIVPTVSDSADIGMWTCTRLARLKGFRTFFAALYDYMEFIQEASFVDTDR